MAAIAGTYGIAGRSVLALVAGADLLCLGGEDAGEQMLDEIRDAIVAAVRRGDLDIDRLRDAARRVRTLAVASSLPGGRTTVTDAATRVAAAALQIAGPLPAAAHPVLVVRCDEATNIAVGTIPWGLARGRRRRRATRSPSVPAIRCPLTTSVRPERFS